MTKKISLALLIPVLLLATFVACKKDAPNAAALNCATTALTPAAFKNNGTAQTAMIKVGLSNMAAGAIVFGIASSANNFTPNTYTTTVTAGQASVDVPVSFDGTTTSATETIILGGVTTSGVTLGTCTLKATVEGVASTTPALNCATTGLTVNTFQNNGGEQKSVLKVGLLNAPAGAATFAISSSESDFTPTSFTATLTAGQTLVEIPIVFDGTTTAKTEVITVSAAKFGTASCTATATITPVGGATTPSLNCANTVLSKTAFLNNSTAQTATLKVGLNNAPAGATKFTLVSAGSNFTPTSYNATLTAKQAFVEIPITFDGTTTLTSETITASSTTFGTGVCTVTATIGAAALATELNCTTTTLSTKTFASNGTAQPFTLTVGLTKAKAGKATFKIMSAGSDFTPATFATTLKDGQTTVAIPLSFDGTSALTSETITVTAPDYATGSCANAVTITPPVAAAKVTYANVNPIFVATCGGAKCHATIKPLLINNYANAKASGAKIVSEVVSKKMPQGGSLTAAEIALIQQWQKDGFLEKQ